jgi:hypothetical protein
MSYVYAFVRKDIPLADQIVQAGHACLDAGNTFGSEGSNLVVLELYNSSHLVETGKYLDENGIRYVKFWEPDDNMGHTALCTEALSEGFKKAFRHWKLWTNSSEAE